MSCEGLLFSISKMRLDSGYIPLLLIAVGTTNAFNIHNTKRLSATTKPIIRTTTTWVYAAADDDQNSVFFEEPQEEVMAESKKWRFKKIRLNKDHHPLPYNKEAPILLLLCNNSNKESLLPQDNYCLLLNPFVVSTPSLSHSRATTSKKRPEETRSSTFPSWRDSR